MQGSSRCMNTILKIKLRYSISYQTNPAHISTSAQPPHAAKFRYYTTEKSKYRYTWALLDHLENLHQLLLSRLILLPLPLPLSLRIFVSPRMELIEPTILTSEPLNPLLKHDHGDGGLSSVDRVARLHDEAAPDSDGAEL